MLNEFAKILLSSSNEDGKVLVYETVDMSGKTVGKFTTMEEAVAATPEDGGIVIVMLSEPEMDPVAEAIDNLVKVVDTSRPDPLRTYLQATVDIWRGK